MPLVLCLFPGLVIFYFLGLKYKSSDLAIPILGVSATEAFTGLRTRLRYVSKGYEMIYDAYEKVREDCHRFRKPHLPRSAEQINITTSTTHWIKPRHYTA